jgi:hypothetical protein
MATYVGKTVDVLNKLGCTYKILQFLETFVSSKNLRMAKREVAMVPLVGVWKMMMI